MPYGVAWRGVAQRVHVPFVCLFVLSPFALAAHPLVVNYYEDIHNQFNWLFVYDSYSRSTYSTYTVRAHESLTWAERERVRCCFAYLHERLLCVIDWYIFLILSFGGDGARGCARPPAFFEKDKRRFFFFFFLSQSPAAVTAAVEFKMCAAVRWCTHSHSRNGRTKCPVKNDEELLFRVFLFLSSSSCCCCCCCCCSCCCICIHVVYSVMHS